MFAFFDYISGVVSSILKFLFSVLNGIFLTIQFAYSAVNSLFRTLEYLPEPIMAAFAVIMVVALVYLLFGKG